MNTIPYDARIRLPQSRFPLFLNLMGQKPCVRIESGPVVQTLELFDGFDFLNTQLHVRLHDGSHALSNLHETTALIQKGRDRNLVRRIHNARKRTAAATCV